MARTHLSSSALGMILSERVRGWVGPPSPVLLGIYMNSAILSRLSADFGSSEGAYSSFVGSAAPTTLDENLAKY